MKNALKISMLSLIMITSTCAVRATEPPSKTPVITANNAALQHTLDRALNKHMSYPILAKADMNGEVLVSFVINKEGKIEILSCQTKNEELRAYVLRKLARIDIGDNPEGTWKTSYVKFNFGPEKV